jgi:cell pole-organizing protein PopZ
MSQPAKAQEPSMEEILASIRRIISDDEAKPAAAAAPAAPPAPPPAAPAPKSSGSALKSAGKPAMTGIPPSQLLATKAAAAPAAPAAAAPTPAEKNSQDDIDAMLASFDAPAPAAEAAPEIVEDTDDDVFELTEQMAVPAPAPTHFQTIEPQDDLEVSEQPVPAAPAPIAPAPRATFEVPLEPSAQSFLSSSTATAVESAFNSLASTVLSNNARTLEDLVKEMLRPMLKSWLDDNLPTMVERLVKAEIERVARGR